MTVTLLIDGDILAYKAAAIHQEKLEFDDPPTIVGNMPAAIRHCRNTLEGYMDDLGGDEMIVCLSDDDVNFRKSILPSYKGHRTQEKPVLLMDLKAWLEDNYVCKRVDTLEADDVMGIYSTHPHLLGGQKIIVSQDKDMLTIPGWLYNPDKHDEPVYVTEEDADAFHLYQALIGDTTDGYKGCPGRGHAAATEALTYCCSWDTVLGVYYEAGYTREDALMQAQVARICRYNNFNYKTKEVIPWMP